MLPLLLLGSISLFTTTNKLKKESIRFRASSAQYNADTLDSFFDDVYTLSLSIFSRSELKSLAYTIQVLDTYEKNQTILQLQEYIRNVKNNNNLIQNIRIYSQTPEDYLLISTGDSVSNTYYPSTTYADGTANAVTFQKITEEIFQFWVAQATEPINIIALNNRLFLVLRSNQSDFSNIVVTEYSISELKKNLAQYQQNDSYYLFDFHEQGYRIHNMPDHMEAYALAAENTTDENVSVFSFNSEKYYCFTTNLEHINASYTQVLQENMFLQPAILSNMYTTVFILLMILSIVFFFVAAIRIIHRPMTKLVNAFQTVETGDLSIRIFDDSKSEFSYLYKSFNHMTEHLDSLINEVYLQKLLLQKAEFKQLQAQINPHFLYNSFFMLQRTIKSDMKEEAIDISNKLGLYFKYITRTQSEIVSLQDEYGFAKIYADIQSKRFEGRISTQFDDLPANCAFLPVPSLFLQPVIENAYNHGLEDKCSDGLLKISFQEADNGLFIFVEDNGENLSDNDLKNLNQTLEALHTDQKPQEITGIYNISQRLLLYSKKQSFLTVTRSNLGGLKVIIFISSQNKEIFQ